MATSTADDLVKLYTNTFINPDAGQVPYKLLTIAVARFEALEAVAVDIKNLNDVDTLTGVNLEVYAEKWQAFRQGKTDAELLEKIIDNITIFNSGSRIFDFRNILKIFELDTAQVIEFLPPENAEVNIVLQSASAATLARVTEVLDLVRAAGIEIDVYNDSTSDKRLLEDGGFRLLEDGDILLLEGTFTALDARLLEDGDTRLLEDGDILLLEN